MCRSSSIRNDVIHSFWVPARTGRGDLVPGHPTDIWIRVRPAGRLDGASAANTAATSTPTFASRSSRSRRKNIQAWLDGVRQPGSKSETYLETQEKFFAFLVREMCHTIQGTPPAGRSVRISRHVASRSILAGAQIPNRPGHMAGWIVIRQRSSPAAACRRTT